MLRHLERPPAPPRVVVDSAVITAINTRMVTRDDFLRVGESVALTPRGRKRFITAYEQRMDALVTHPLFGYRVSYRRVLEIQVGLLARVVSGESGRYSGFETQPADVVNADPGAFHARAPATDVR